MVLRRWCAWAAKNARSYSFLAAFLSVQKSDNEEKVEGLFLSDRHGDHVIFQMLTA